MDTIQLLQGVEVFDGLDEAELKLIAGICHEARYTKGQVIASQGNEGDEIYIVREGLVEVMVNESGPSPRTVVHLGTGQVVGEMALVDRGPRSATVRCITDASAYTITRDAFEQLCQAHHHIGMVVYRNLAADLSFKVRHSNLTRR